MKFAGRFLKTGAFGYALIKSCLLELMFKGTSPVFAVPPGPKAHEYAHVLCPRFDQTTCLDELDN